MEAKLAGHYQIVQHLGGGGFGQTFLAKDNHLPGNPICVVKQLKPRVNDPGTLETAKRLFDREAETLYRLGNSHRQIPRLLAHFEQEGEFYLVQEFIEGHPLDRELILGKKFNEAYIIDFLQDVLQTLAFVHSQNVIHRDLKPANLIRRSSDRKIVVIDFGAVKEVHNQPGNFTEAMSFTVAVGSPGYMPIEQRSFKPRFSSDLYAVGIMCFQALTGLPPRELLPDEFTGELSCDTCQAMIPISLGLANILDRMVRYDYRQRYQTAIEALQAVGQLDDRAPVILSDIPTRLTVKSSPDRTQPPDIPSQQTVDHTPAIAESSTRPMSSLNSVFLHRCQQELTRCIGPMASLIVEDILAQYPQITPQQFIEEIATEIPNPQQAKEFQNRLLGL